MGRRLSDAAIRYLAVFEELTEIEAIDCVIDDEFDRVAFVVPTGWLADAIGPGGATVERVESRLGREVVLVEGADTAADFVANALRPAAVYAVTIDDGVAHVEVPEEDRGAAIGRNGRRIELARCLARRHYDLQDIELV